MIGSLVRSARSLVRSVVPWVVALGLVAIWLGALSIGGGGAFVCSARLPDLRPLVVTPGMVRLVLVAAVPLLVTAYVALGARTVPRRLLGLTIAVAITAATIVAYSRLDTFACA